MSLLQTLLKKKLLVTLTVVVIAGGSTWTWKHFHPVIQPTRYLLANVTRGTIITSVNGSGQVSGQNQLDIKPLVSGAIKAVLVKPGQMVKMQDPLFEIDQKTTLKTLRDASQTISDTRISLASAQLSFNKLKQPPDAVALTQAQNTLNAAKRDLEKLARGADVYDIQQAEADLRNQQDSLKLSTDGKTPTVIRDAYDDAVPLLKSITQMIQTSLYDADSTLGIDNTGANDAFERLLSITDSSKLARATSLYPGVKSSIAALKQKTDALNVVNEEVDNIEVALQSAQAALNISSPLMQTVYEALLNTVTSPTFSQSSLTSLQTTIQSDRSNVATKMTSLVSQLQAITQAKTSFATAQFNVAKAQASLDKLKRGANADDLISAQEKITEAERSLIKLQAGTASIDLALAQNSIDQRRAAVADAEFKFADIQQTLQDHTIRAPFVGAVAKVTAQVGDQVSPSTVLAILLTPTKLAQISLNEVDATKVHVGQKATLTFDAIPGLTIAGSVYELDPLGTVTQGVVNYTVKTAFETQDERIKSGMSVAVSIVTDVRTDVLLVPNATVRRQGINSTVQTLSQPKQDVQSADDQTVLSDTPPQSHIVQTGLSNDQSIEIVSGVNENDQVIVRTIDPAAAATAAARTQAGSTAGLRIPGVGGGSGGANRGGGALGR